MRKCITFISALICVLSLAGCQKAVSGSEMYSFPEPTTEMTVTRYSQGEETVFEISPENYDHDDLTASPVISWFYNLELTACDEPEAAEGAESYVFNVSGEDVFTYEDRGSEAYIIINGDYYRVSDPSAPPVDTLNKAEAEPENTEAQIKTKRYTDAKYNI